MGTTTAEPAAKLRDQTRPGEGCRSPRRPLSEHIRRLGPIARGGAYIHSTWFIKNAKEGHRLRNGERIRLRLEWVAGRWVATDEAIDEFIDLITRDRLGEPVAVDDLGHPATTPAVRTPARRAREIERATEECISMNA
jgi:hypothetical protein